MSKEYTIEQICTAIREELSEAPGGWTDNDYKFLGVVQAAAKRLIDEAHITKKALYTPLLSVQEAAKEYAGKWRYDGFGSYKAILSAFLAGAAYKGDGVELKNKL